MISRVWWIAVSYATRPLILAMAGLGILFLVLGMIPQIFRPNTWWAYPGTPSARLMVDSRATLETVRKNGRQQEVDGIDLVKLWPEVAPRKIGPAGQTYISSPDDAFYKILDEFPNLRSAQVSFSNEPNGIERLTALTQLEYLSLNGVGNYDLAPLQSLRNLRRLDISLIGIPRHDNGTWHAGTLTGIGALASLPRLDTLVLARWFSINDEILREVGTLPHLSVLALTPFNRLNAPKSNPIIDLNIPQSPTKAGFDELARGPVLKTLYVGGFYPEDHTKLTALARASAPHCWIFSNSPASVFFKFVSGPFTVLLPSFWFALAIGAQLSSQFLGPGRQVVPRFTASHALVAVALSMAAIALGAARLTSIELTVPAAIAASAALVTSLIMMATPSAQAWATGPSRLRAHEHLNYLIPILVLNSLGVPGLWGIWLNSPIAVVAYALVASATTAKAVWNLSCPVQWPAGSGSQQSANKMRREMAWAGVGSAWMFATRRRDQKLEQSLLAKANLHWWQRIERWRLANPPIRSLGFAILTLGLLIPATLMVSLARGGGRFDITLVTGLVLGFLLAQVAMTWRARLLVLPLDFLRPYSRPAMQRELAVAFALDVVPIAALFGIVQTVGICLDEISRHEWRSVGLSFLVFLALGCAWGVAGAALLVLVRRLWISIVLLTVLLLANVVSVWGLVRLQSGSGDLVPGFVAPALAPTQLWLPILTGTIVCCILWRRWLHIEIGQCV